MSESTNIAWTDATWSPWWGCSIISPACTNCYAKAFSERVGHGKRLPTIWGPRAERRFMGEEHWKLPRRWNRKASRAGAQLRVFCASMADIFEFHGDPVVNAQLDAARARLWVLIEETPHLTWQLLTKRPENIAAMIPSRWRSLWPENIWLGVTAENQEYANERLPPLLESTAAVKFISAEPLLGPIDFDAAWLDPRNGGVAQVIVGGESGPNRRAFDVAWLRQVAEQCRRRGTALFVKQDTGPRPGIQGRIPADLWVQEVPAFLDHVEPTSSFARAEQIGGAA